MKRIICILLAAAVLLSGASAAFAASMFKDTENSEYENSINALAAIGIINGRSNTEFAPGDGVTRAEFVTMLLRLLGMENAAQGTESKFEDIRGHWAEGNITAAHSMGLIDGMSEAFFGADSPVTFNQAVKMAVSLLGFRTPAENRGGYPNGYISVARSIDILKKVGTGERNMHRDEAAQLLLNVLTADTAFEVGGNIEKDENLLTKLGYKKLRGTVTSTCDTQTGGKLSPMQIEIASQRYDVKYRYEKNLIGADVIYYLKDDGTEEAIYYIEEKYDADTLAVKSENIEDGTTVRKLVYTENNKTKSANISSSPIKMYYNGKLLSSSEMNDEALKPESGSVVLRDTDRNGEYDVVIINAEETVIVKSVSGSRIYGSFGESIDTDIDENQLDIEVGGREAAAEDIKSGMILTVRRSLDKEKISIAEGGQRIYGSVVSIDDDRYSIRTEEGESEYYLTPEYVKAMRENRGGADKIDLRKEGEFCISSAGKIAAFTESGESKTKMKYAYLIKAGTRGALSGTLQLRVVTEQNTIEVLEAAVSIKFGYADGGSYSEKRRSADEILPLLAKQTMLTYKTDENGAVTELYLPDNNSSTEHISIDLASNACTHAAGLVNQKYILDGKTVVFNIPNSGQYEDIMSSGRYNDYFKNDSYTMELYDIENMHVGAVLYTPTKVRRYVTANDGFETILDKLNSPVMYISKITYEEYDGEDFMKLTGYEGGREKSVYVGSMLNGRSEAKESLAAGQVIQYELNTLRTSRAATSDEAPQMVIYKKLFDCRDSAEPQIMTYEYGTAYLTRPAISTIHSYVSSVDDGFIGTELGKSAKMSGGTLVLRWNSEAKRFEPSSEAELAIGQRVFIRQRYLKCREVVILP